MRKNRGGREVIDRKRRDHGPARPAMLVRARQPASGAERQQRAAATRARTTAAGVSSDTPSSSLTGIDGDAISATAVAISRSAETISRLFIDMLCDMSRDRLFLSEQDSDPEIHDVRRGGEAPFVRRSCSVPDE